MRSVGGNANIECLEKALEEKEAKRMGMDGMNGRSVDGRG
jgi:hypothetical protein